MTDEEIKALQDAKIEADRKVAEAEALVAAQKAEAEKAKLDLTNVVEELKLERQKKIEALSKANITNPNATDVNSLIEEALKAKEDLKRKQSLEEAVTEFKSSKTEFQTDTAGIVFAKFQEELKKFNLSDVVSKDEAKKRLEEIYRFVNFKTSSEDGSTYEGSSFSAPNIQDKNGELNKEVKVALDAVRMSEDAYKKLKGKYPEALAGIGL